MIREYNCEEHNVHFGAYVPDVIDPDDDLDDGYFDQQVAEHEELHAEETRASGRVPAIAIDGDRIVFGQVAQDEPAPAANGRDLHRKIVRADLEQLAEHAYERINAEGHRPASREWEVLRSAADAAASLADLLPAVDEIGIEGRDVAALGEHALSVLGRTIEPVAR